MPLKLLVSLIDGVFQIVNMNITIDATGGIRMACFFMTYMSHILYVAPPHLCPVRMRVIFAAEIESPAQCSDGNGHQRATLPLCFEEMLLLRT